MIEQRFWLACVFACVFLTLASCDGQGSYVKEDIYHKGFEGLTMRIHDSSPPDTLYMGDRFNAVVFIENNGAYDLAIREDDAGLHVVDDYAVLDVAYDDYYLILESSNTEPIYLSGKSFKYPLGDGLLREFFFRSKVLDGQQEHPFTPLIFTLCYPYQTELAQDICIDTDYYGLDQRDKVCTMQDISLSQGQGAPLAITRIEPRAVNRPDGTVVDLMITIENRAGGNVISRQQGPTIGEQCSSEKTDPDRWDTLMMSAELMGKPLHCANSDGPVAEVKLRGNEVKVRCSTITGVDATYDEYAEMGTAHNFMTTLYITLDYLYQESTSKKVEVLRLP